MDRRDEAKRSYLRVAAIAAAVCAVLAAGVVFLFDTGSENGPPGEIETLVSPTGCKGTDAENCVAFRITCPGVGEVSKGEFAVHPHRGEPRGVVVAYSGLGGGQWWAAEDSEPVKLVSDLLDAGYTVVQVRYATSWLASTVGPQGVDEGVVRLACRPATTLHHLHESYARPMDLGAGAGLCGFCATGNSAGATQITYALAYYGLGDLLDAVIVTGGPPHSVLDRACLGEPGFELRGAQKDIMDASFGGNDGPTPCREADREFVAQWRANSIGYENSNGGDVTYCYPTTRVVQLIGADETQSVRNYADAYLDRLISAGSPDVTRLDLPGVGHRVHREPLAQQALLDAVLGAGDFVPATVGSACS